MSRLVSLAAFSIGIISFANGQGKQQQQWPSWLPEKARDIMNELNEALGSGFISDETCRIRLEALKTLSMVANPASGHLRATVLQGLGFCDMRGDSPKYPAALRRFESAISELNVPNEDALMANLDNAPFVLLKEAAKSLRDYKIGEAGVALRRCKMIYARQWDRLLKQVMKQHQIPKEGLAQVMPNLMKEQVFITVDGYRTAVDAQLEQLDSHVIADKLQADKKKRLDSATGTSLMYFKSLLTEPTADVSRLPWVGPIVAGINGFAKELDSLEKAVSFVKRTIKTADCEKLPTLCSAITAIPDVMTNGFGESRLLRPKEGKRQNLDSCESNGNIGVAVALKGAVALTVGGATSNLEQGSAMAFDFCIPSSIKTTSDGTVVLLLQAWHPEISALERTTLIRERSEVWKLDEGRVKTVTKLANDAAKKSWEKNVKAWREGSTLAGEFAASLEAKAVKKREEIAAAEEEARKAAEAADTDKEKARAELLRKRQEMAEEKETKAKAKAKKVEEVRMKEIEREPWKVDYRVVAARTKLEELKEERRDANNKMEFDESNRLTKEISKAEFKLESLLEKARKYFKKHGKVKEPPAAGEDPKAAKALKLKTELEGLEKRKQAAIESESYSEAAELKKKIADVKAKIDKMEL